MATWCGSTAILTTTTTTAGRSQAGALYMTLEPMDPALAARVQGGRAGFLARGYVGRRSGGG